METTRFEFLLALIFCVLCLGLGSPTSKTAVDESKDFGLKIGNVYKYEVGVCGLSTNNHTRKGGEIGAFVKIDLYIQPLSSNEWSTEIQNFRRKALKDPAELKRCASVLSDESNFQPDLSKEPYLKINLTDGVVTRLNSTGKLPESARWLKFFARVLQLDLKGKHCGDPANCLVPTLEKPDAVFKTMETYLEDKTNIEVCETQYKVTPLSNDNLETTSPKPSSPRANHQLFEVERTADYKKCLERFNDTTKKARAKEIIASTFISRAVIVGNINNYTIKSAFVSSSHKALDKNEGLVNDAYIYYFSLNSTYPANDQTFKP